MLENIVAAAAQGAVAAAVAALLSAFTEPIVNRLLVHRCTLAEALARVKVKDCLTFFLTTFPTNMLKFPVFEIINTAMAGTSMSGSTRGIVNGAVFCTIMLPVTNFRYRKSMKLPVEPALLYQAYPPTVLRDIVYGWSRGLFGGVLKSKLPTLGSSFSGSCALFGLTIWIACIVSSPMNEWRGYWLQPPERKLKFSQFFKPARYVRSTGIGATIMGISLSVGMAITPLAKEAFGFLQDNLIVSGLLGVMVVAGIVKASK